jgi:DNA-binding CsgD family transcriptional regulator
MRRPFLRAKIHRARVLEKFGVTSVAELVRIAAKLGIEAA